MTFTRETRLKALEEKAKQNILLLDGAMGSQLQNYELSEEDFKGDRFQGWNIPLKGNNEALNLTRPHIIQEVYSAYYDAGADIIESNTFSATQIAQADYQMESYAAEIAREGTRLAREVADNHETANAPKAIAGAIGPTNKTLSLSPDVNNPGFREVTFDEVKNAYREQINAMVEFSDFFLIETIFDTLNAKAAIKAVLEHEAETGLHIPMMISGTITDASGRTLSGQTTEAFWHSVRHAKPWAVGLNCALGADAMRQYVEVLARICDTRVLAYPNAGLPNEMGEYDETPEDMAKELSGWAQDKLLNVVGGCCGTTPPHIKAIGEAMKPHEPRNVPIEETEMKLSGLEPFKLAS